MNLFIYLITNKLIGASIDLDITAAILEIMKSWKKLSLINFILFSFGTIDIDAISSQ